MEKEQDQLEFLGFIGILKESINIISSRPNLFSNIALAFILPLTFTLLLHNQISNFLTNNFSSKWILYWGIEAAYFIFIFIVIFSLLSISAVVYTTGCIYSGKEVTFNHVLRAIPKVWKRLFLTLASNFCIIFAYTLVILLCSYITIHVGLGLKMTGMVIVVMLLSGGVIYVTIFWQLANVISVMEDHWGFEAMKKSRRLIKGKLGTAIAILWVQGVGYVPVLLLNQQLLKESDNNAGMGYKILVCGVVILVLHPLLNLYSLVVQTVFYCVCKSYHHESIDKANLADHLGEFSGDYIPLLTETIEIV